jgi:hypothetical protein
LSKIRKPVIQELHHRFGYPDQDIEQWTDLA